MNSFLIALTMWLGGILVGWGFRGIIEDQRRDAAAQQILDRAKHATDGGKDDPGWDEAFNIDPSRDETGGQR